MFFTRAVMTVLVEVITKKNIYSHYLGVIEGETAMIIFSAILSPFVWIIHPWDIYIKTNQMYSKSNKNLTQDEANHIMEKMSYQMGKRYA